MIEVRNLKKKYGQLEAVKGVDFDVGKGEIVGLLGPNGAGKTTIMKILTGYMFPTEGVANLNSVNVVDNPVAVKKTVGYLPENTPLYNDLNVTEYLSFIAQAHMLGEEEKKARLAMVINECGLEKVLYRDIGELSKGFRQRVGLAQAILHDPQILILDEPTTGLDPNQIIEIRELIRRMGKEKTVMISTHILQEVEAICSRVLILNEGYIVAKGTTKEIARELQGEDILVLTLKGSDPQKASESLATCPAIGKVLSAQVEGEERIQIRASLASGQNGEEAVFDWAVQSGYKILSIVPQHVSLEEIFIKLTREGSKNGQ